MDAKNTINKKWVVYGIALLTAKSYCNKLFLFIWSTDISKYGWLYDIALPSMQSMHMGGFIIALLTFISIYISISINPMNLII